jgi:ribonuclease P protein component
MEPLRKKKDFQAVFQNGKRFFSPYAAVIFMFRSDTKVRAGIVVGVKTAKKAVARNRIRRKTREAFRAVLSERPLARGMDIVFLPKLSVADAPFSALKSALATLIANISNS